MTQGLIIFSSIKSKFSRPAECSESVTLYESIIMLIMEKLTSDGTTDLILTYKSICW